ncbi:MAG: vWA domain-containing protein, partial [Longimicrobiales bacterium]
GWRGTATLAWVLWLVVSVPTRTVWVGVTTAWLLTGAVVGGGGRFAFSTVSTGVAAVPDAVRLVPRAVQLRKRGDAMSSSKLTRERWLSLIATLWVFGMVGFVGAAMVWPAPPEPVVKVVHWATGHLLRDWSDMRMLPAMATEFNEAGYRTESGTLIEIEVYNSPSSEGAADLLCRVTSRRGCHQIFDGEKRFFPDPTIISPSSGHWLVTVNHEARREVVDLESARSIATAFIGIVTYKEMAECLGWPEKELGYADILALSAHEDGWSSAGDCAKTDEWGERPLVAFTDPKTSSTGRSVLLALYAIAADKDPVDLTVAHVGRKDVVDYVKEFQGLIDHYSIGTTVLNTKIHQGPRYGHFFLMPEDNLIHLVDGTELAYRLGVRINAPPITDAMVMIYPKEGAMARNNCACIVDADWVTPEHREAADQWIDFLLEDAQQRSFMLAGFRPVTGLSLDDPSSRINARYGLDPEIAAGLDVALMDPAVAAAIDASWEDVKRPGIVTFVVDTSGSMMGGKLRQAKDGLARALGAMATNNQVGFVSFADTIDVEVPVAALRVSRYEIGGAVKELRARGDTALYDAIRVGIEMTEAAAGPADAIRAVVVLTDGQANAGRTRLDDLIAMESNEVDIARFDGFSEGPAPVDRKGRTVSRSAVVGVELATGSDVQIFFIGIGDDADLDIGRILAEATGAEFRGVAAEDLALLLEEFSGYF